MLWGTPRWLENDLVSVLLTSLALFAGLLAIALTLSYMMLKNVQSMFGHFSKYVRPFFNIRHARIKCK